MWRTRQLYEVCDIQSGLWKGKKEPFTKALVLRNTNFTAAGKFDYSDVVELEVETKQLIKREVVKNDIILEKSGGGDKTPVGRVCIHEAESELPFSLSNFTARIRVLNHEELDAQFLHRFLYFLYISGKTEPMQRHSTGIRNLQLSQYKEIDVPLPPLAEQQRIVAKLDAAFDEIDKAIGVAEAKETELELLKASLLTTSLKDDAEIWQTVKIGEICDIVSGSTPSRKENMYWEDGEISWFTIDDMREQGRDIFSTTQHVTQTAVDKKKVKIAPYNSVLLCCTASIGEAAIARKEMATNQQFNALTPKDDTLSCEYLYYFATTLKEQLLRVSGSTTISFVSMGKLKEIEISFPPSAEQKRIVAMLDVAFCEIETAYSAIASQRSNFSALKSAILAQELQPSEAA